MGGGFFLADFLPKHGSHSRRSRTCQPPKELRPAGISGAEPHTEIIGTASQHNKASPPATEPLRAIQTDKGVGRAYMVRACLKIGNMRNGEGFFCWSRQIFAEILCAFQENLAEKEPPSGRVDIFQASPKEIPVTDIKNLSSPPCQLPASQPGVNLPHGPFPPPRSHRQQGGAAHRMEQ